MADFGPRAPHGPDMNGKQDFAEMHPNEKEGFDRLLRPDDSYTAEGVYWADLPIGQRVKFVTSVDNKERSRQWSALWAEIKQDPLSPMMNYFRNTIIPGAGIGLEGYVYPIPIGLHIVLSNRSATVTSSCPSETSPPSSSTPSQLAGTSTKSVTSSGSTPLPTSKSSVSLSVRSSLVSLVTG